MKRKTTDVGVRAFIEAVCPEAPDLYMASFDEATCLRDATNLIRELRGRNAAEARVVEAADKYVGHYNTAAGAAGRVNLIELGEAVMKWRALRNQGDKAENENQAAGAAIEET